MLVPKGKGGEKWCTGTLLSKLPKPGQINWLGDKEIFSAGSEIPSSWSPKLTTSIWEFHPNHSKGNAL